MAVIEPAPAPARTGRVTVDPTAHAPVDDLAEAEALDEAVDPPPRRARIDAPQPGVDLEVAPPAEPLVQHLLLEHGGAHRAGGERLGDDVEAGDAGDPRGRRDRGGEHPDRRRLARAVGPE